MNKIMKYISPFMLALVLTWITVFVEMTPDMYMIVAGSSMLIYCLGTWKILSLFNKL